MMPSSTIQFDSMSSALLFLKRTCPRSIHESWQSLAELKLLRNHKGSTVALEIPAPSLDRGGVKSALKDCEGAVLQNAGHVAWEIIHPVQQLFRVARLESTNHTEQAARFLVVPQASDQQSSKGLIGELSKLEEWAVLVRTFLLDGRELLFFELQALKGQPLLPPAGLPGAPLLLAGLSEDVFVPPGYCHPLLPSYRFLFPPLARSRIHMWLPPPGDELAYQLLQESDRPAEPLARLAFAATSSSSFSICKGAPGRIQVPLELRHVRGRRPLRLTNQVVYRAESRAAEFGPLLLRLLDHVEAGVEQFKYYSRPLGEGPNAQIEHYLLTDSRIADEDAWPDLQRFDCLRLLGEIGLPLFIPADLDFVPNLEGLLRNGDADDPLLEKIRELAGLSSKEGNRLALVLPTSENHKWEVLHLEQGRSLAEVITPVMLNYNRERIRRVVDITRLDLQADRRAYEEQWIAAGGQEAKELAEATETLSRELIESAGSLDQELGRLGQRLKDARQVVDPAAALLSTDLPRTIQDFARRIGASISALAEPHRSWLESVNERQTVVAKAQADAQMLLQDTRGRVEQLRQSVERGCKELSNAQTLLSGGLEQLRTQSSELENRVNDANSAATQAQTTLQERRQRLQAALQEVQRREEELTRESSELDTFQGQVEERERQVRQWQEQLRNRRRELSRRLERAEQNAREAEAEEGRLRHMEQTEIPAAEARYKQALAAIEVLRKKGIEARHAELSQKIAAAEAQLASLRRLEEDLVRLEQRLKELQEQIRAAESRIAQLRSQRLDENVREAESTLNLLQSAAASAEEACRLATQANLAIQQARELARAANSSGIFPELESRISILEKALREVSESATQSRPENHTAALDQRLSKLEKDIGEIRLAADLRHHWWNLFSRL